MGDFAHFGIIDSFNENRDYATFEANEQFSDVIARYHCVGVPDDILSDWENGMASVRTYFHRFSRPETGFARAGVTLIPPESLSQFIHVVSRDTQQQYRCDASMNVSRLLDLLALAQKDNKFVIHFGI